MLGKKFLHRELHFVRCSTIIVHEWYDVRMDWQTVGIWLTGAALAWFAWKTHGVAKEQHQYRYKPPLCVQAYTNPVVGSETYKGLGEVHAGVHWELILINPGVNPIAVTDVYLHVVNEFDIKQRFPVPGFHKLLDWSGEAMLILAGGQHETIKVGVSAPELRDWLNQIRAQRKGGYFTARLGVLIGYEVAEATAARAKRAGTERGFEFQVEEPKVLKRWIALESGFFDLDDSFQLGPVLQ